LEIGGRQHDIDMRFGNDLKRFVRLVRAKDFQIVGRKMLRGPIEEFDLLIDDENGLL
jgi:hypothetical protein